MIMMRMFLRFVRFEAGLWRSLSLLAIGRIDGMRPGTTAVGYHRAATPIWAIALFVTCAEVPAVHLAVPWPAAKAVLLVLGVWGVLLIAGMWASYRARPYLVDTDGIRLRMGLARDIRLPWSQVSAVTPRTVCTWQGAGLGTAAVVDGDRLAYVVGGQTSVVIALTEPLTAPPGITEIHVGADDPAQLIAALASAIREQPSRLPSAPAEPG
jgi:hypothetical protein